MKLSTFLLAIVFIVGLWIIFPYLFVLVNQSLELPIINNLFLKFLGVLLLTLAIGIDLYLFRFFPNAGKGTPIPVEPTQNM